MSLPSEPMHSSAATAAALPPEEPPGILARSHGLWVGPKAEVSVDEPIANSSMLSLPSTTAPAALSLEVAVASYGGTNDSRILEPQVHGIPSTAMTSLMASGTPVSGGVSAPLSRSAASAASASARALSSLTVV